MKTNTAQKISENWENSEWEQEPDKHDGARGKPNLRLVEPFEESDETAEKSPVVLKNLKEYAKILKRTAKKSPDKSEKEQAKRSMETIKALKSKFGGKILHMVDLSHEFCDGECGSFDQESRRILIDQKIIDRGDTATAIETIEHERGHLEYNNKGGIVKDHLIPAYEAINELFVATKRGFVAFYHDTISAAREHGGFLHKLNAVKGITEKYLLNLYKKGKQNTIDKLITWAQETPNDYPHKKPSAWKRAKSFFGFGK